MRYAHRVDEIAHDLASIIDADCCGLRGARGIDLGDNVVVQEKAMECAHGTDVSHDLAAIIDLQGIGVRAASMAFCWTMAISPRSTSRCAPRVGEEPYDPATPIDIERGRGRGAWEIDQSEDALVQEKPCCAPIAST
jgi:hypothetical protein